MAISSRSITEDLDEITQRGSAYRSLPRSLYIGVYVALAVLVFLPVTPWSNTSIPAGPLSGGPGAGDPTLITWFLEWTAYALSHGHNIFFTNYLFSPRGTSLFPYTSVPLLGVLAAPVTLKLGPVAAYNLLIRLSLAGSAVSMFLVLSSWCRRPYAFMGGLLFGFSPYIMTQSENHLNLAFLVLLPPMMWCVTELIVLRRYLPVRLGAALGFFAALQMYVSPEILLLLATVLCVGVVAYFLNYRHLARAPFGYWLRGGGTMIFIFCVLAGYYVYNFLFGPGHLAGPVFPVSILQLFHSDLLGPLLPTANEVVTSSRLSSLTGRFLAGNITENGAYVGLPLLAVSTYYGLRFRRYIRIVAPLSLAGVALILSLGDKLTVAGRPSSVPLPEALLRSLPLLKYTVPARFGAIVVLFLAVALACGTQLLIDSRRASLSQPHAPGWVLGVVGLSVVLSLVPSVPVTPLAMTTPPQLRAALSRIPEGSEVFTYPFPLGAQSDPMIWQEQSRMNFRLLGSFIRKTSHPDVNLELLQSYFLHTSFEMSLRPANDAALVSKGHVLRRLLVENHVRVVILWDTVLDLSGARRLLDLALGPAKVHAGTNYAFWIL